MGNAKFMILYPVLMFALSSDEILVDVACHITSKIETRCIFFSSSTNAPHSMIIDYNPTYNHYKCELVFKVLRRMASLIITDHL